MHAEDAAAGLGVVATVMQAAMRDGKTTEEEQQAIGTITGLWLLSKGFRHASHQPRQM
jgi:hypothetical protein